MSPVLKYGSITKKSSSRKTILLNHRELKYEQRSISGGRNSAVGYVILSLYHKLSVYTGKVSRKATLLVNRD